MTIQVLPFPLDAWLVALATGWHLPNPLELPHAFTGPDGAYMVRMWRPA